MSRKIISILIVISMLLCLVSCKKTDTPSSQGGDETKDEQHIIKATNLMAGYEAEATLGNEADEEFIKNQITLALKLFKASANESNGKNVLISPLSIQLALAMTANGANGQTKAEMEKLLGGNISLEELNLYLLDYVSKLPTSEKYKLEIANSIWLKNGGIVASKDFLQTNKNYYDAQIYDAPFDESTVKDINSWVNDKTDGMIDEIVKQIDPNSIMFLINAIMFDAEWASIYSTHAIRNGEFTSISGEKQTVDMMHSAEHRYIELDNATGFKKNYKYGKYSFVALLPNEGVSLDELINSLNGEELVSAIKYAEMVTVNTSMPKFSYEYTLKMNDVLKSLGMNTAFDDENADFSKMGSSNGNIYVGSVTHKTFITVDEAGTKAGAVTSVEMDGNSAPTEIKVVNLDRPFLYMIVDNQTSLPIFIGTLTSVE
ncbi:MAG: serine protease [Ruminococcaceae bacterium]|nr:serine protease [Oscillospiraceae bacterium]